jgi:hypothetical protein
MFGKQKAPVKRWLAIVGVLAACTAGVVAAVPAFATNEYFECNPCETDNGPNNYIKEVTGIDHSGQGACVTAWRKNSDGSYTRMDETCVGGGETGWACSSSEVYGHGEVKGGGPSDYLRGRQDNFPNCGE